MLRFCHVSVRIDTFMLFKASAICLLLCYSSLNASDNSTSNAEPEPNTVESSTLQQLLQQSLQQPPTAVSINLCADQLIMLLAEPQQILSLSNLSHQRAGSFYYEQAQAYPVNEGHAEQVLTLQPDIIIAGQFSNPYTLDLLREVGLRVETIPIANSIDTMLANIAQVAAWLGHESHGEAIVDELNHLSLIHI